MRMYLSKTIINFTLPFSGRFGTPSVPPGGIYVWRRVMFLSKTKPQCDKMEGRFLIETPLIICKTEFVLLLILPVIH